MLNNAEALRALETKERKARATTEGLCVSLYGHYHFTVYHTPASPCEFQYRWGLNMVERHTALRVVQTFEEAPRR